MTEPSIDYEAAWLIAEQRTRDAHAQCDLMAEENERLRTALQKAIRSHENLVEFVLPDRYKDEGRHIIADLQAALEGSRSKAP